MSGGLQFGGPRSAPGMRWALARVALAVTSMIALAFLVPLGIAMEHLAEQNAQNQAESRITALEPLLAVTTSEPDLRDALSTLGGELADVEGVAEAYSVTGEWDFVAILRLREQDQLAQVVTGRLSQLDGVRRTQTMVAFEAYSQHDLEALFSVGQ